MEEHMQKAALVICAALMLLAFACSENDDPTDTDILGYSLDQFVSSAAVHDSVDASADAELDFRGLFSYEIVSSADGFSPRASVNAGYDLPWDTFQQGYYVPQDNNRTWFPNSNLPGAFKVNQAGFFRLYRTVKVDNGIRGEKNVELRGLTTHTIPNWNSVDEEAIRIADLLQGIAAYDSVQFTASDGYTRVYVPEHVNDGYYLLSSEVTTFPNYNASMTGGQKKFKKLAAITVYGATGDTGHTFALALQNKADMIFTIPASMTGYTSTVMDPGKQY